jgi:hypothetical protein
MIKIVNFVSMVVVAFSVAGCATVTRGTTNQVQVISEPSGAQVTTSIGNSCPATPCTFEVSRKSEFFVTIRKEGFQEASVPIGTRVAGGGAAGFAGNILLGGVVGMAADAATGATLEHYPNPVHATLVPIEAAPTPSRTIKRRRPVAIAPRPASPEPAAPVS